MLTTHGLTLEKDSTEYRLLSRLALQGFISVLKVERERWDGIEEPIDFNAAAAAPGRLPTDSAASVNPETKTAPSQPNPPSVANAPTVANATKPLSEVITAYFKEHKREPRTDSQMKAGFEKFMKVSGSDRSIGEVTKEHCRTYKEGMAAQGLSASSINKYLHGLSHLLAWAKGQGFVPDTWMNPVNGLRIKKQRGNKGLKRSPFTDEELTAIFDSPKFTRERTRYSERYWLPLCLLWTGTGRDEIAQLYLDDIRQVEGVWIFDIKEDEKRGQGLKNDASQRMVPVHSRLIELGLLEYVRQTKATGAMRLFPTLTHGGN